MQRTVQVAISKRPHNHRIGADSGEDFNLNQDDTGAPGHCDKQSCIVSEGTPDLSGRAFHHADPLPHECGVPVAVPAIGQAKTSLRSFLRKFGRRGSDALPWGSPDVSINGAVTLSIS
jgi:hypothetical protein